MDRVAATALGRGVGVRSGPSHGDAAAAAGSDGAPPPPRTARSQALVHEVVGQFGFWRIVPAETLRHKHVGRDPAVYAACSEAPYNESARKDHWSFLCTSFKSTTPVFQRRRFIEKRSSSRRELGRRRYPPTNGWRPLGARPRGLRGGDFAAVASAPAPTVRSVVSSMYSRLDVHEQLRAGAPAFQPSQTYGYLLILMIGALLWALVLLVSGVRLKSGA